MRSEKEKIALVQEGKLSFEVIYNDYFTDVFKHIYYRTGDKELTKDLVSDVFIKVHNNMHKYKDKGFSFTSWVLRIASNHTYSYLKKKKQSFFVSITNQGVQSLEEEFEIAVNEENETTVVNKLFNILKQEEAEMLRMRFFEGLSFKEISDFFEWKESATKMKLYRLLEKLRGVAFIQEFKSH